MAQSLPPPCSTQLARFSGASCRARTRCFCGMESGQTRRPRGGEGVGRHRPSWGSRAFPGVLAASCCCWASWRVEASVRGFAYRRSRVAALQVFGPAALCRGRSATVAMSVARLGGRRSAQAALRFPWPAFAQSANVPATSAWRRVELPWPIAGCSPRSGFGLSTLSRRCALAPASPFDSPGPHSR